MRVKTTSSYVSYISITTSRCSPSCPQIVKDCPKRKNPTEKKKKRTLRLFHAFKARLKHNAGKLQNVELSYNFSKACRGISRLSVPRATRDIGYPFQKRGIQHKGTIRNVSPFRALFSPRVVSAAAARFNDQSRPVLKAAGQKERVINAWR